MITPDEFRNALRHFPAGVTLLTIRAGGQVHGLTVSAFASVSADPPLILVIVDRRHKASPLLAEEGAVFAVNILAEDQSALSDRFAWLKEGDRFAEGRWGKAATGAPILEDALAWLDCTVHTRCAAGSHDLYIGQVHASAVPRPDEAPLVYWNREYRKLEPG